MNNSWGSSPRHTDIISILRNKFRLRGEIILKFDITRVKNVDIDDILTQRNNAIYWVSLSNRHTIALTKAYIIDTEFERTLPRNRTGFRISAEINTSDVMHNCIVDCYKINKVIKKLK